MYLAYSVHGKALQQLKAICWWCLWRERKPVDATEFLTEFVAEADGLTKNGFIVGDTMFSVKIHSFVCDAPARAFVKGVKIIQDMLHVKNDPNTESMLEK